MKRCRAKMIDGRAVTFEHRDLGPVRWADGTETWSSEMIGHGFHVACHSCSSSLDDRIATEIAAMKKAGVDLRTFEIYEFDSWLKPWTRKVEAMIGRDIRSDAPAGKAAIFRDGTEKICDLPDAGPWRLKMFNAHLFATSKTSGLWELVVGTMVELEVTHDLSST